jgi:prepilin-type N-terminal cleavage/methylation domain-containing protein
MASTTTRPKHRARGEAGFTLIEVLVVLVIVGILVAVAVTSYLGYKDRANRASAQANVRSAIPAVETYHADNGSYDGMSVPSLTAIDAGLKVTVISAGSGTYCLSSTQGAYTAYKNGPDGAITSTACA